MPSKDSITKTIRLNAEDTAFLEDLMKKESLSYSGAIHRLIAMGCTPNNEGCTPRGVPQTEKEASKGVPLDKETMEDIERMCFFSGLSVKEFISKLCEAMNEGTIRYENGRFITESGYDLSRLEEACHEKNIPVQKAIEKCIQMIWKS